MTKRTLKIGTALSILHFILTVLIVLYTGNVVLGGFDTGVLPSPTEQVIIDSLSVIQTALMQPGMFFYDLIPKESKNNVNG